MAEQGLVYPGLLTAIQAPSFTMGTLPDNIAFRNQVVKVTDIGGVGLGLMWSDGTAWFTIPFAAQRVRATTAADGTYTWVYPTAFATGTVPKIALVAEATAGSTDVINAQVDGTPTETQVKVRVTRTQKSVVALLGLTILSVPANPGATVVDILAFT